MNDYLRSSAFIKAEQIFEQSGRLKILPFPSPNPALFASFICTVCQELKLRVSSPDVGAREIELIPIFLVDQIAPTLRIIEGASSENTPASLVVPVERIGEEVLPGSKFMVRRQWRYNYSVRELRSRLEEDLKGLLPEAKHKGLFAELPERLYAISFPSFERDNALLHVNFAHEIAHPLQEAYLSVENSARVLQELRKEVEVQIKEEDPLQKARAIGSAVGYAARLRQAALMEILSDTISACVFGPSALFALHEVASLSRSMDKVSPDLHPPWRFRLRHMLDALQELGFVHRQNPILNGWPARIPQVLSNVRTRIDDWLRNLRAIVHDRKDLDEIRNHFPAKQAYESVERAIPTVRKFAAQSVARKFSPSLFSEEVPSLLERLYTSLPPNQIENSLTRSRRPTLASILASGWLYKLTELAPVFAEDQRAYIERIRTLNRLVLKAIELSEI